MKIGAHVSTREPFSEAVNRAADIGCECMQIFCNAPQRWNPTVIRKEELDNFKELNSGIKILPIVVHGIYLINLASDNPFYYEASVQSLIDDMKKSEKLGGIGVNFHVGSTKGKSFSEVLTKITSAIKNILAATPESQALILENSAGAGNIIGDKFEELAQIIKAVGSDRLKVTLDTAHAYASGYNLVTTGGLEDTLGIFDKTIGLGRLVCLHLNDSAVPLGSLRDRHADIGDGYIGKDAFKNIINHKLLKELPGIIETPGNKGKTDIDSIKILKELRK
ncbi:MAG: putative endonuclease 4 [bacterium ADurb.Bin212]|nr:MAG: putative endonuclease 4 [bacterium ADurb.Bin212]